MAIKTVYEVGMDLGIEKGQRRMLHRFLENRFGPLSEAVRQRLAALPPGSLEDFAARIGQAESLAALGLAD